MVWMHMLSLPVQLVGLMGWWSVEALGITAFIFIIVLEIGFGYDINALVCKEIILVL